MVPTITRMTMELYKQIVRDMPPTPSKFHYIFNLRDLSRIYNGLCLSTPDRFKKPDQMVRLWFNEVNRVICDRLISVQDKEHVHVSYKPYVCVFCKPNTVKYKFIVMKFPGVGCLGDSLS